MLDYQQLEPYQEVVASIRAFLAATDQTQTAELSSWAKNYVQWCQLTNERLRRCQQYLQKGLRAEAIQLADEHPPLLDLVTLLDFPETGEWRGLCVRYSLPEPPALNIETAKAVNEAYAEVEPLAQLLAKHRLLGVARAPLKEHLAVLRQLAEKDPMTPYWEDDVRAFETIRLEEIKEQVPGYAARGLSEQLRLVREELQTPGWRIPIGANVQRAVDAAFQSVREHLTEKLLAELLPKLNEAYSAMDLAACREHVARWHKIIKAGGVAPPESLVEQVRPVEEWIAEEDNKASQKTGFESACQALQQALDRDAVDLALDRAFRATTVFPFELPGTLETQYHSRKRSREAARKHRRLLTYVAAAAAVVVVFAIAGFVFWQTNRSGHIDAWVKALNDARSSLTSGGDIEAARRVSKSLRDTAPELITLAPIIKASTDLENAIKSEEQRAAAFAEAVQAMGPAEAPDTAAVGRAKELARTYKDKLQLEDFEHQVAQAKANKQQAIDRQFSDDASALAARIERQLTPSLLASNESGFSSTLAELRADVELLAGRTTVSESLRTSMVTMLQSKIAGQAKAMSMGAQERQLISDLQRAGGSCQARGAAMQAYLQALPDGSRASDFRRAIDRLATEKLIESWLQLVWRWGTHPLPATERDAKARIEDARKYIAENPKSPFVAAANDYISYLQRAIRAAGSDGPWRQGLAELMKHPMMRDLYTVETSDEKTYFVPPALAVKSDSIGQSFLAFTSTNIDKPQRVILARGTSLKKVEPDPAPQKKIADDVLAKIELLSLDNWDTLGADTVDLLAAAQFNPVLKGLILQQVLDLNKDVLPTSSHSTKYVRVAEQLAELRLHKANWLDPNQAIDANTRSGIVAALRQLPKGSDVKQELQGQRTTLFQRVTNRIASTGILLKHGGSWQIYSQNAVESAAALVIPLGETVAVSGTGTLQLQRVARQEKGQWVFDASATIGVPEGSAVFIASGK